MISALDMLCLGPGQVGWKIINSHGKSGDADIEYTVETQWESFSQRGRRLLETLIAEQ